MPVSGEQPQTPLQLGDYRLVELLSEGRRTRTYHAEQISVDRDVVLERIKTGPGQDPEIVEHFLAAVRAKAAVDHPGIGSVYEAVCDDQGVFYTRELLKGETFEELHDRGIPFKPATIALFLRQVASAMDYYQQRDIATLALELRHLVLGDLDVLRIANLAVAEEPDCVVEGHDRYLIAELFLDLLQCGAAGATRTRNLLNMMTGEDGTSLTWMQVAYTARKLEEELSEGAKVASQAIGSGSGADAPRQRVKTFCWLATILMLVAALATGGFLFAKRKAPPKERDLSGMIGIPAGTYQTHDGKTIELAGFWMDAHEVTIGEYAGFLTALASLPKGKRTGYDDLNQPTIKFDHIPDEWESMLNAARTGGSLEGLPLDLNFPITRIDWWDAQAYAKWKGGRLPTQEEWLAATQGGGLAPSKRGAVDQLPGDVTPSGIHGLAGNISEWVQDPAKNPAFPMNPKSPLCCGASYLTPRDGVRARTWHPTREIRRRNLGFRIVRGTAP
jgi:formylglycine-generating enzyme required for sulfatase activity